MGKMMAVCGSPNCVKTTAALKLAQEIYGLKKTSVMFLSPDLNVPCMAYLFPNGKDADLYSLGVALDKTDIYKEDVLKQTVNVKNMQNFGYRPTEDKVTQLFTVLKDNAEYVIVDCSCDPEDIVSSIAKRDCDVAVQMFSPDMKCISFYASCVNQFILIEDKRLKVMNVMDKDIYVPIHETETHFKGMDFKLPYERELKQQMITGTLSERIGNCKYRSEIERLAKAVV